MLVKVKPTARSFDSGEAVFHPPSCGSMVLGPPVVSFLLILALARSPLLKFIKSA